MSGLVLEIPGISGMGVRIVEWDRDEAKWDQGIGEGDGY